MHTADRHAKHRGQRRRQCRATHSHPERKHQHIIKYYIEKTAAKRRSHRHRRRAVIAHKRVTDMIPHKKRGKHHKDCRIFSAHCDNPVIAAQQRNHLLRHENTSQNKNTAYDQRPQQCIGKIQLRLLVPARPKDFKPNGRTDADHRADRKNQAVHRQHKIQRRNPVRPLRQRDKKSIRKNIHRNAQHPKHIL